MFLPDGIDEEGECEIMIAGTSINLWSWFALSDEQTRTIDVKGSLVKL